MYETKITENQQENPISNTHIILETASHRWSPWCRHAKQV